MWRTAWLNQSYSLLFYLRQDRVIKVGEYGSDIEKKKKEMKYIVMGDINCRPFFIFFLFFIGLESLP